VPITAEGYISQSEFISFYTDLSINIPSDQAFSDFVSAQWGAEQVMLSAGTVEEVKAALKTIRFKLLQKTSGTHEEFILRKVFNEFDSARRGLLGEEELSAMLTKLEIPTERRLLAPLIGKLSQRGDGCIDFADFEQFLFYDPFHL
jgi:Ca2+-binding EF-hand superfamily protein